jgi:uncharacterized protein
VQLQQFLKKNHRIALAFSGGDDSTYLMYAAKNAGCDVRAYFIKSQLQSRMELNDAIRIAARLGVSLTVDALNILDDENVVMNAQDRCYYCKAKILKRLRELAREDGFDVLCDEANADDDESEKPAMRAVRELGVLSPLRECGLTKIGIRRLSQEADLPNHDKPAYACLANRIPTGTPVTVRLLEKIERAEEALSDMGFSNFCVRFMPPGGAKIEMPDGQIERAATRRADILAALQPTFNSVLLDLAEGQ